MPKFLYTAKAIDTGLPHSGEVVAKDEKELAQELRGQGLLLTSHHEVVEKAKINIKFFDRFQSVPLKEKMVFTRNLAVMVSSGLTLSRGIHNLSLQTTHKGFQKILQDVFEEVQAGKALSEGLAKYPKIFNELFTNMVAVGEVSGNLERSCSFSSCVARISSTSSRLPETSPTATMLVKSSLKSAGR